MLTRRQRILLRENEAAAGTSENKKRKVKPTDSPRSSKRSNNDAKVDVEPKKSTQNLDKNSPSVLNKDDSSNTPNSVPKSKRPNTAPKHTKSKPSKSHDDMQMEASSHVPTTEKTSKARAFDNAIEQVLASNFVDVQKRLKLFYPAKCIQSVVACQKDHVRNSVRNYT